MLFVIDALVNGVPTVLVEIRRLGRTLKQRAADILTTVERLSADCCRTLGSGYHLVDAISDDVDDALEDGLTFAGMVGNLVPLPDGEVASRLGARHTASF